MRKGLIFRSNSLLVAFFLVAPSAHAIDPIRNYQVDVISIQTSLGSESVTEQNSKAMIDKVNSGFDEMVPGLIHFTFRKLYPSFSSNSPITSSSEIGTVTGITPKADPGFEGVILIAVIAKNPSVPFAGQAGGSFMLVNGNWTLGNAFVVTHEFGHNMGLMHANSATCTNQLPIICDQYEYGDYSSFMGNYVNSYVSQPYIGRLSATELDHLKVLPANKRSVAVDSGEYKLAPVYSNMDLPKVLFVPIGNEYAYSVEYRPAIGNDSSLALTQIYLLNQNSYYSNTPSYGLQLRIIKTTGTAYSSLLPKLNNFERFETALVSDTLTGPQIQPIGKSFVLSDGSTVTFVSADPNIGAVVKVVRPADTEAPKLTDNSARWAYGIYYLGPKGERLVKRKTPTEWDFPVIEIPTAGVSDNRLLKSLDIEINGKVVETLTGNAIVTTPLVKYPTTDATEFSIRLIGTDFAGNTTESPVKTLASSYYQLWKTNVVTNYGADFRTSIVFSFYRANSDTTYQLTNLSAGSVASMVLNGEIYKITIEGIPRNSNITAILTGTDKDGHTDGGQQLSGVPSISECSRSECFVGVEWKVDAGNWSQGVGIMSLQELVGKKWVTVKTAKPQNVFVFVKKYPISYDITMTYTEPGKHTYRLFIAATKKFGAYTGKSFTQQVKP